MTALKNHPYNYKAEQVHLARMFGPSDAQRFSCHRCSRSLPMESFEPLFTLTDKIRTNRKHLGWVQALHPICWTCRKQIKGVWVKHELYSPALDRFCNSLITTTKTSAAARSLIFALAKDDVVGMFIEQNGRCAISGLQMDFREKGSSGRGNRRRTTPSIDRIDSNGNYTKNNVHLVCAAVNVMKSDLPLSAFLSICESIAGYQLEKHFK